jgi:hypothetical protein
VRNDGEDLFLTYLAQEKERMYLLKNSFLPFSVLNFCLAGVRKLLFVRPGEHVFTINV